MAREAGDIAWAAGWEPLYVARNKSELDSFRFPQYAILEAEVERYNEIPFVIGIGENTVREFVADRYRTKLRFTNLIHPSATFGQGQREVLERSSGNIVAAGARFTNGIEVGEFCIFNQNTTVAHDCLVDSFVHVAPGANVSGNVHLKRGCWIGAAAVINQGSNQKKLAVGEGTVIGSGAVVLENCTAGAVYVGVPAKRIR